MATSPTPWFVSSDGSFVLYEGDCRDVLPELPERYHVNMVFADPPYFLSNDGITCQSGRMVSVNKGEWDRLESVSELHAFNQSWLASCQQTLDKDGTIWVSGTRHIIYSVGFALQQLRFKLLNEITWEKPNPPPNLSRRYFTHSTETLVWAAATSASRHTFNYDAMRQANGGKQMKSVWTMAPPRASEKGQGKHPTQKPLALLERVILSSTLAGDLVLDPFTGSGTTGIAATLHGRRFVGIEKEREYLELAKARYLESTRQ